MASEFIARRSFHTDHRSPIRFVLSHIRRHWIFGVTMVIGAFSNAALAMVVPYYIGEAFNAITQGAGLEAVGSASLAIIASQIIRGMLQLMRNFSAEVFAQRIERDVRDELYASLLGKSMSFHDLQPVGEIMARVTNDVREMNFMMNPGMNLLVGSGMFLITPLIAAPSIPVADHLAAGVFHLLPDRAAALHPPPEPGRTGRARQLGRMNASVAETISSACVKGAAQEGHERTRFARQVDEVRDFNVKQGDIEARYLPICCSVW
ncbi:MAG: ABC transporter transmembrane domain-containing protein [Anaerolineae bacterium]